LHVTIEGVQKKAHVTRAAFYVLARVEDITDAEASSRSRHQLHKPACPFRRNSHPLERRFRVHLRVEQYRIESVAKARFNDVAVNFRIARRKAVEGISGVH